jgi:hypothetical protein
MGRQLRVPRARLEELAGGPLSNPTDPPPTPKRPRSLRSVTTDADQGALPFSL